jgi:Ca-activated chloride channel family protein
VTVTGRWRGRPGGTITVRGTAADGTPFENKVLAATGGNPASTANWARAHLRDLEDRYASLAGHDAAELARLEHQITDVSLRYSVLCRFTAFVAVDSRVVTDGAVPHRVTQPVELPAGWAPTELGRLYAAPTPRPAGAARGARPMMRAARAVAAKSPAQPLRAPRPGLSARRVSDADRLVQARRQLADEVSALRTAQPGPDADRVLILADLATRIDALLAWLTGDPAAAERLTELTALARKLRDCDTPRSPRGAELEALWEETIHVLAEFAAQVPSDDAPQAPPGSVQPAADQAFWKRPS